MTWESILRFIPVGPIFPITHKEVMVKAVNTIVGTVSYFTASLDEKGAWRTKNILYMVGTSDFYVATHYKIVAWAQIPETTVFPEKADIGSGDKPKYTNLPSVVLYKLCTFTNTTCHYEPQKDGAIYWEFTFENGWGFDIVKNERCECCASDLWELAIRKNGKMWHMDVAEGLDDNDVIAFAEKVRSFPSAESFDPIPALRDFKRFFFTNYWE